MNDSHHKPSTRSLAKKTKPDPDPVAERLAQQVLRLWHFLVTFEEEGYLDLDPAVITAAMSPVMQESSVDVLPAVIEALSQLQDELDALEEKRLDLERRIKKARSELTEEDIKQERIRAHQSQIDNHTAVLADLTLFLIDLDPIEDETIIRQWRTLAQHLRAAAEAIDAYLSREPDA